MGRDNTRRNIKKSFYWHNLYNDVAIHVATCATCSKNKKANKRKRAGMTEYHAGSPMERVHLDVLGPFNTSSKGNKYVLGMIDQFTKWLECVPLPDQSAEKKAISAIDNFFCRFGMPLSIHTDQGSNLVGNVFKSVCELLEICKTQTTPYHPESNCQIERYHHTIVEMVWCLKLKSEKDLDIYLPHITSAIRCLENPSTGFTANKLMLGTQERYVHKPVHIHFDLMPEKFQNAGEYVKKLDEVLRETHPIARSNSKGTLRTRKSDYDVKLNQATYQVGDKNKINSATLKGVSKKLLPIYDGPFLVTRVLSPVLIEIEGQKKKKIIHHDKLKICRDHCIPLWIRRRRQELLSLDDTLPYDEAEHSLLGDAGLDTLFDDNEVVASAAHQNNASVNNIRPTLDGTDNDPIITSTPSSPSSPSIQVTRRGQKCKQSTWLRDFVTD